MPTPDKKEKCGVFGVWGADDSAHLCYTGLYALQHRGQESAGIAVSDGSTMNAYTGMGLVAEVFNARVLNELRGKAAIGHNRYSTTGSSACSNAQPLLESFIGGQVAVAHNGNLVNADLLRRMYEERGHIFHTSTDTEVIIHLLAAHFTSKSDPLVEALQHLQGAYSLVFLFHNRIEAMRDPWGWRPLVLGETSDGFPCVASETVALDAIRARYIREVEPGEIVTLSDKGVKSRIFAEKQTPAHCIFEHIYFANPSSMLFGDRVELVRQRLGQKLSQEAPVKADYVIPMPDSGRSAALGYSEASNIPYREGIVPNRYVGRTFIKPTQSERDTAVQLKLNVISEIVNGRKLIVVDDSIVRGTTTRGKMRQLRRAGAEEIHLRISCPPIRNACYYGIDFPDTTELIANQREVEDIAEFLEVDSLHYLSHEGMLDCVSRDPGHYCTACFNGQYRVPIDKPVTKLSLERHQLKMFT